MCCLFLFCMYNQKLTLLSALISVWKKVFEGPSPELFRILGGTWDGQSNFLTRDTHMDTHDGTCVCLQIIFLNQLTYCKGVFDINSPESQCHCSFILKSRNFLRCTCCQSMFSWELSSSERNSTSRILPSLPPPIPGRWWSAWLMDWLQFSSAWVKVEQMCLCLISYWF